MECRLKAVCIGSIESIAHGQPHYVQKQQQQHEGKRVGIEAPHAHMYRQSAQSVTRPKGSRTQQASVAEPSHLIKTHVSRLMNTQDQACRWLATTTLSFPA
mmetsp:Transcript_35672/g.102482  ORF Transcript_35672/g.102482 Transcript_35672/m.102482 type:complete len:101 (-) Transcript_35672:348-650(-)